MKVGDQVSIKPGRLVLVARSKKDSSPDKFYLYGGQPDAKMLKQVSIERGHNNGVVEVDSDGDLLVRGYRGLYKYYKSVEDLAEDWVKAMRRKRR